jgi:predicted nucleotidyltransferase
MQRAEVIDRLKATESALKAQGVQSLYLYGSYARDEARPDSDLDVFVDPFAEDTFGLSAFMDSLAVLESSFPGTAVGFTTREGIVPSYRPYIERSAIRVF